MGQLNFTVVDAHADRAKMVALKVETDGGALAEQLGEHPWDLGGGGLSFLPGGRLE